MWWHWLSYATLAYIRHFIFAGCYDNDPWYLVTNLAGQLDLAGHLDLAGFYFNSLYCQQWAIKPTPGSSNFKKSAPDRHYYLQRAVKPNWMGSIALWEHIIAFFSRAEKLTAIYFWWIRQGQNGGWVYVLPWSVIRTSQTSKLLLAPQTERRQIRRTFFNVQ